MGEGMIPDRAALVSNPLCQTGELVGLNSNQEERRGCMFGLENVENLRSPLRIGAVIECDHDLVGRVAVSRDSIRLWQGLEDFVVNHFTVRVHADVARAVSGLIFNAKNLPLAFHVDLGAWGDVTQFVGCPGVSRHIPYSPQRTVLAAQSPHPDY